METESSDDYSAIVQTYNWPLDAFTALVKKIVVQAMIFEHLLGAVFSQFRGKEHVFRGQ